MQERDFFEERPETKTHTLMCPHCSQENQYELHWLMRRKKQRLPPNADARDSAQFEKARSYMLRQDDMVGCKNVRCRKRFEVAGIQSVAFVQDVPNDSIENRTARIRAAFDRRAGQGTKGVN